MSKTDKRFGGYEPIKKRPAITPTEFFKKQGNGKHVESMKPLELAELCYSHFDGRSQLKQEKREP